MRDASLSLSMTSGTGGRKALPYKTTADLLHRQDRDDCGLDGEAGDDGFAFGKIDVHLTSDTKLAGQIDAGFDGEAGMRQQSSRVVGFEVVDVRAVAMHF